MTPGKTRLLFVALIFTGSFLLFLVQPMIARMALPQIGGAPNVWNSAMLVYQTLLLGGYFYADVLRRMPFRRQVVIHCGLFALAILTLPIGLAEIAPGKAGLEVIWVPWLFLASIGPIFLMISAQAPLMQAWYGRVGEGRDPYALYAASNAGSFTGLLSYPLLLEPNATLATQSEIWSIGYVALVILLWVAGGLILRADLSGKAADRDVPQVAAQTLHGSRKWPLWLALSAVPSGLMLSTTTHITTDIIAMPLLWVIPLGLYLLSFVVSFAEDRGLTKALTKLAPFVIVIAVGGSLATSGEGLIGAGIALLALFLASVALHGRLYDTRPEPGELTRFYLVMSAGGALGGLFTALVAPVIFDWVWEHPILLLGAAALLPLPAGRLSGYLAATERRRLLCIGAILCAASIGAALIFLATQSGFGRLAIGLTLILAIAAVFVSFSRAAFLATLVLVMLGTSGIDQLKAYRNAERERSYFGIYNVREDPQNEVLALKHGTTIHGLQNTSADLRDEPTAYYGRSSGVGLAMQAADAMHDGAARVGVIGLGAGTLACYRSEQEHFTFFEIDPVVADFARGHPFSFIADCAPDSRIMLGDARLEIARLPPDQFDVLVVDAFSSDSIPMHLLTREALQLYARAVSPGGLILIHVSNRYLDLEPVVNSTAGSLGWTAITRRDLAPEGKAMARSIWIATGPSKAVLGELEALYPEYEWGHGAPSQMTRPWTDEYSSILPHVRWGKLLR